MLIKLKNLIANEPKIQLVCCYLMKMSLCSI